MAPPVYSVRFLVAGYATGSYTYTVPPGRRAVIRYMTFNNRTASSGRASFYVSGVAIWEPSYTGPSGGLDRESRLVAYGGEILQILMHNVDCSAQMHGFLFEDTLLARQIEQEYVPELEEPTAPGERPSTGG